VGEAVTAKDAPRVAQHQRFGVRNRVAARRSAESRLL